MSGILTVVGTPLGNLGDMSPRAVEALRQADFIAAEDTRVTLKLLNHFEIKKPMISYFEHNRKFHGELICQKIEAGENCALVSDAGMPAISDPGEDLVRLCGERGSPSAWCPGQAPSSRHWRFPVCRREDLPLRAFYPRIKRAGETIWSR